MVQLKEVKSNKKGALIPQGKQQPKKPQLQFASSDEEDDSEEELGIEGEDGFEDDDDMGEDFEGEDELDAEEMDGEDGFDSDIEMEAEDDEDDGESDEDTGPLKKTPGKGLLKALQPTKKDKVVETPKHVVNGHGDAHGKTPKSALKGAKAVEPQSAKSKKAVEFTADSPSTVPKTPATPHPSSTKAKGKEVPSSAKASLTETPQNKSKALKDPASAPAATGVKKRKAADIDEPATAVANGAPVAKLSRTTDILNEEQRRRDERNKRTLFLKSINKMVKKTADIKSLHPDIVSVRTVGTNAWVAFASEATCTKAYDQLKKMKVKGKSLQVDYCGKKALHQSTENILERPINLKKIVIQGIPNEITAEKLKIIFPAAKDVEIPKSVKEKRTGSVFAFLTFGNEQEAQAAFRKGESLKIGGTSVEVLYARQSKHDDVKSSLVKAQQQKAAEQKPQKKQNEKQKKQQAEESPDDDAAIAAQIAEQQKKLDELQKKMAQKKAAKQTSKSAGKQQPAEVNGSVKKGGKSQPVDDINSSSGDDDDDIPSSEEGIEEMDSDDE